jgi:hypothetical protein
MAVCIVVDLTTNEVVNTILANPTDIPPVGCKLVEVPEGYYWENGQLLPYVNEEIIQSTEETNVSADLTDGN